MDWLLAAAGAVVGFAVSRICYTAGLRYGRYQERQRQRLLSMARRRPVMWHEIPSAWSGSTDDDWERLQRWYGPEVTRPGRGPSSSSVVSGSVPVFLRRMLPAVELSYPIRHAVDEH